MDPTEPNPAKTTAELLDLVRRGFRVQFDVIAREKCIPVALPPFFKVEPNGKPGELELTFRYQDGLAHELLDCDEASLHLADHLELVYHASELHTQLLATCRSSPRIALVLKACTSDPNTIHIDLLSG